MLVGGSSGGREGKGVAGQGRRHGGERPAPERATSGNGYLAHRLADPGYESRRRLPPAEVAPDRRSGAAPGRRCGPRAPRDRPRTAARLAAGAEREIRAGTPGEAAAARADRRAAE